MYVWWIMKIQSLQAPTLTGQTHTWEHKINFPSSKKKKKNSPAIHQNDTDGAEEDPVYSWFYLPNFHGSAASSFLHTNTSFYDLAKVLQTCPLQWLACTRVLCNKHDKQHPAECKPRCSQAVGHCACSLVWFNASACFLAHLSYKKWVSLSCKTWFCWTKLPNLQIRVLIVKFWDNKVPKTNPFMFLSLID